MAADISVIVPVYRNAATLTALHERLAGVLRTMVADEMAGDCEMLFVNDG